MGNPVATVAGSVVGGLIQSDAADDQARTVQQTAEQNAEIIQEATDEGIGYVNTSVGSASGALGEAMGAIREGAALAAEALTTGNAEAARAYIEAAKIKARGIMDAADVGVDTMAQFFNYADSVLKPTIDQGGFAADEYASMLGIPNARGEIVPFDEDVLRNTPGYQFRFSEMNRALENTAAYKGLSSQQLNRVAERNDQLAMQEYNNRLNNLRYPIGLGAQSESTLAGLAQNTGLNMGRLQYDAGAAAAGALGAGVAGVGDLMAGQGLNLANLYNATGNSLANINMGLGNLYMNQGNALANLTMNQANALAGINSQAATAQNYANAQQANALGSMIGTIPMIGQTQQTAPGGVPGSIVNGQVVPGIVPPGGYWGGF